MVRRVLNLMLNLLNDAIVGVVLMMMCLYSMWLVLDSVVHLMDVNLVRARQILVNSESETNFKCRLVFKSVEIFDVKKLKIDIFHFIKFHFLSHSSKCIEKLKFYFFFVCSVFFSFCNITNII